MKAKKPQIDLQKPFYTHDELAALIGIHPDTFWHWRADGYAPRLTQISPRRSVFMKDDVDLWLKTRPKRKPGGGSRRNGRTQQPAA